MSEALLGIYRCGTAFVCPKCGTRVVMDELFARVAEFPDVGFPIGKAVCLPCGRAVQRDNPPRKGKGR